MAIASAALAVASTAFGLAGGGRWLAKMKVANPKTISSIANTILAIASAALAVARTALGLAGAGRWFAKMILAHPKTIL